MRNLVNTCLIWTFFQTTPYIATAIGIGKISAVQQHKNKQDFDALMAINTITMGKISPKEKEWSYLSKQKRMSEFRHHI